MKNSHLAQSSTPGVSFSNDCRRTIGVSPMRSVIFSATRMRARRMTSASLLTWVVRSPAPAARGRRAAAAGGGCAARTAPTFAHDQLQRLGRGQRPGQDRRAIVDGRRARGGERRLARARRPTGRAPKTTPCRPRRPSPARRSSATPSRAATPSIGASSKPERTMGSKVSAMTFNACPARASFRSSVASRRGRRRPPRRYVAAVSAVEVGADDRDARGADARLSLGADLGQRDAGARSERRRRRPR